LVVDEKADAEDTGLGAAMKGAPIAFSCWAVHLGSISKNVGVAAPAPQHDARGARVGEVDDGVDRAQRATGSLQ
jgi:hypothetical protein